MFNSIYSNFYEYRIEILFKITIFALLSYLLYDLIRQYVIPALRRELKTIKEQWKNLSNKKNLLNQTKKTLKQKIKDQDEFLNRIEIRLANWYEIRLQKQKIEEENYKKNLEKISNKKFLQDQNVKLAKARIEISKDVINQINADLTEKFSGDDGKNLMSEIVDKTTSKT